MAGVNVLMSFNHIHCIIIIIDGISVHTIVSQV